MRFHQHHHTATEYPAGRVDGPGLLYGGIGVALAVAMQLSGLFKQGDIRLQEILLDVVFRGETPDSLSVPVLVMVAAVFCFGMAFAVLDSPGIWRRVVLGISAMVIMLAMVPTFAVWKVYFSPFLPSIALFWTWFCTMMYVNHHVMPCDAAVVDRSVAADMAGQDGTTGVEDEGNEDQNDAGVPEVNDQAEARKEVGQDG